MAEKGAVTSQKKQSHLLCTESQTGGISNGANQKIGIQVVSRIGQRPCSHPV